MCRGRAPGMGRSGLACHTVGYRLPGWASVWRRPKDAGPWVLPFPTLGLPGSLLPPCLRHLHQIMKMSSPNWILCHQWVTNDYHQAGRHGPSVTCDIRSPEGPGACGVPFLQDMTGHLPSPLWDLLSPFSLHKASPAWGGGWGGGGGVEAI